MLVKTERLTRKEEKIQEHENKLRAIRNAKHQAEKEKLAKRKNFYVYVVLIRASGC